MRRDLTDALARAGARLASRTGDDPPRTQWSAFSMAVFWGTLALGGIITGSDWAVAVSLVCQSIWLAAEWVRREIIASEQRLQREDDQ